MVRSSWLMWGCALSTKANRKRENPNETPAATESTAPPSTTENVANQQDAALPTTPFGLDDLASASKSLRLLLDLVDLAVTATHNREEYPYYAVIVPEDAAARVVGPCTGEELAQQLKAFVGTRTQAIPFRGLRLSVTKYPNPYLLTDCGKYPLFDTDVDDSEEDYGFLGPLPPPPALPDDDADEAMPGDPEDDQE